MPSSHDVIDLLPSLRGVDGLAVRTDPGTTVTEGQAYAMFVAGMQRDTPTLQSLTVAWQANGQGFGGVSPACGGCCPAGGWSKPRDACTAGGKCGSVQGAYMPAWRMPLLDSGFLGSATDADEDAVTGLIYLAELTNDAPTRACVLPPIEHGHRIRAVS